MLAVVENIASWVLNTMVTEWTEAVPGHGRVLWSPG